MTKLNYWNATWSLDEAQCPCDAHFVEYLKQRQAKGAAIFHFGSGNHHIVGLKAAEDDNAVLSITAVLFSIGAALLTSGRSGSARERREALTG